MIFPVGNIARKLKKLSHKGQEILADLSSTIFESFSGVKVVRAFGMELVEEQKFNDFSDSVICQLIYPHQSLYEKPAYHPILDPKVFEVKFNFH